jgi:hypothetical protein
VARKNPANPGNIKQSTEEPGKIGKNAAPKIRATDETPIKHG